MEVNEGLCVFWFRRDLRLYDNTGLFHALRENQNVIPLFIFDTDILDRLSNKADRRVEFIHRAVHALHSALAKLNSSIIIKHGSPDKIFRQLISEYPIRKVYANHDYEPAAIARDASIASLLKAKGIAFSTFKDQVIFEKNEVIKEDGSPYTIFTPYMKKWKAKLDQKDLSSHDIKKNIASFYKTDPFPVPSIEELGFKNTGLIFSPPEVDEKLLLHYDKTRDIPSIPGTSRLSVHLRFGTISIRALAGKARARNEQFLNELIWREFYMMILFHFPHSASGAFKKQYDRIPWINNEEQFDRWCKGETGYPIVDAGMKELNATGFMHNRVRMITAGFLVKHLLIDWRWGEAYFAEKLLDYDLAANNGGWQWAAGSGCDAAPYFRVFNPAEQTKRFDPELKYIRKWVPGFDEPDYPAPIVDHKFARERVLNTYKKALGNKED
ncbi:MAG: cryptochrome/photolyase family protein [Bacteroidia bacterium]